MYAHPENFFPVMGSTVRALGLGGGRERTWAGERREVVGMGGEKELEEEWEEKVGLEEV